MATQPYSMPVTTSFAQPTVVSQPTVISRPVETVTRVEAPIQPVKVELKVKETIREIPMIQYVEKFVDRPEVMVQLAIKEVPKIEVQEVIKEIPRYELQVEEKLVEKPLVITQEQ